VSWDDDGYAAWQAERAAEDAETWARGAENEGHRLRDRLERVERERDNLKAENEALKAERYQAYQAGWEHAHTYGVQKLTEAEFKEWWENGDEEVAYKAVEGKEVPWIDDYRSKK
jgi:hypothetical protein